MELFLYLILGGFTSGAFDQSRQNFPMKLQPQQTVPTSLPFQLQPMHSALVQQPQTNTGFVFKSSPSNFVTQPGTMEMKFEPVLGTDTTSSGFGSKAVTTRLQCIGCMHVYQNQSLEELRWEDYQTKTKALQPWYAQGSAYQGIPAFGTCSNMPSSPATAAQPQRFNTAAVGFNLTSPTPSLGINTATTASSCYNAPATATGFNVLTPGSFNTGAASQTFKAVNTPLTPPVSMPVSVNSTGFRFNFGQPQHPPAPFLLPQPSQLLPFQPIPQQQLIKPPQYLPQPPLLQTLPSVVQQQSQLPTADNLCSFPRYDFTSQYFMQELNAVFSQSGFNMFPIPECLRGLTPRPLESASTYSKGMKELLEDQGDPKSRTSSGKIKMVSIKCERRDIRYEHALELASTDKVSASTINNFALSSGYGKRLVLTKNRTPANYTETKSVIQTQSRDLNYQVDTKDNQAFMEPFHNVSSGTSQHPVSHTQVQLSHLAETKEIQGKSYSNNSEVGEFTVFSRLITDGNGKTSSPLQKKDAACSCNLSEKYSDDDQVAIELPIGIKLSRSEYYTLPPLEELAELGNSKGECFIRGFTVGRLGYGNVYFPDTMNVANLDLDEIVHIQHMEVTLYPDDAKKPPVGTELNRPAQCTLDNIYPIDPATKEPVTDLDSISTADMVRKLDTISRLQNARFVDYRPETGSWVFMVPHFSRFRYYESLEKRRSLYNRTSSVPWQKSLVRSFRNCADVAIFKGRSFRVGWGKGRSFYVQTGKSNIVHVSLCSPNDSFCDYPNHLRICFENSKALNCDTNKPPLLQPKLTTTCLIEHSQAAGFHKEVFDLCLALWGADSKTESGVRRSLTNWLKQVLEARSSCNKDEEQIFACLIRNSIQEAAEFSLNAKMSQLSLLIAQAGTTERFKSSIRFQISHWLATGAWKFIPTHLVTIYLLLAGIESVEDINLCQDLDWKNQFGLHLWYFCPIDAPISEVIEHLSLKCNEANDTMYQILLLKQNDKYNLEKIVVNESDPLDFRLAWILLHNFRSLNVGILSTATCRDLHLSFANQLEADGHWVDAVMVLLYLDDSEIREKTTTEVLQRNIHAEECLGSDPRSVLLDLIRKRVLVPGISTRLYRLT